MFGLHKPTEQPSVHLGIDCTNIWNCTGGMDIIIIKNIPSVNV